jgi:murein DD-endopeptidase MepM/ murein hydrolase activator NlpD
VISAGWNSGGYGNLVKIQHSDNSVTYYAHNSRILVRPGQQVKQGQQIAAMGSTGFSTGPHLHFEVHKNGQGASNPIAYLPSR